MACSPHSINYYWRHTITYPTYAPPDSRLMGWHQSKGPCPCRDVSLCYWEQLPEWNHFNLIGIILNGFLHHFLNHYEKRFWGIGQWGCINSMVPSGANLPFWKSSLAVGWKPRGSVQMSQKPYKPLPQMQTELKPILNLMLFLCRGESGPRCSMGVETQTL